MSEHMGDTTSSASEKPERAEKALTLTTARNMLPLVRRIVNDVMTTQQSLAKLRPEHERLNRMRRTLSWPERSRRYELHEEVSRHEQDRLDALAEMEVLGIVLLDPDKGRIGFPTMVNGRRAYFSWHPSDENLRHWQFAGEGTLRTIPTSWVDPVESAVSGKR